MIARAIVTVATLAALMGPGFALAQMSVSERFSPGQPPVVVASGRALDTGFPEDSLARIEWAIDRGVDVLPVAVQVTRDGHHIVMHDGTLTRTTNVREVFPDGPPYRDPGDMVAAWQIVADYTLEEIRRLRLLDPNGGDHPVPTLEEALDLIDGRILVVLDLQAYEVESLAGLLAPRDTSNLLLFGEGDRPRLREIAEATGIGIWDTLRGARDAPATLVGRVNELGPRLAVVDVESEQMSQELVAQAERLGVLLCVRTVSREDMALMNGNSGPWLEALEGPATVFMTQYPDAVLSMLGR